MLKQFIVWLVTKFLTVRDIAQLVVDNGFKESPRLIIDRLYNVAHSSKDARPFDSFERVAAKKLSETDLSGSLFITVLFALQAKLMCCASNHCQETEYKEFFRKVNVIKQHTNPLKVRKDLYELVRKETFFGNELDITLAANVLQHSYIDPEIITKFLTTGASK